MLCPKCGTENVDQAESCVNCHESSLNKRQGNTDTTPRKSGERSNQNETKAPDALTREVTSTYSSEKEKPAVSKGLNITIIVATIFIPLVGIAMGYTYFRKDHPEAKKAGKNWLILGLIMFILNILFVNLMK